MARIPPHIIDRIRDSADIVDVVQRYVNLKRRGRNYLALCPFHKEKTPSFTVSREKQIFHCFGCGASGNVFSFLMQYEKISFVDAVKRLAAETGIEIPTTPEFQRQESDNEKLYRANQIARDFFAEQLRNAPQSVKKYLESRNIDETLIKQLKLGYAPEGWDKFVQFLQNKKFPLQPFLKLGLIARSEREGRLYDKFRHRLIFPIHNLSGKIVGFGARQLSTEENAPKYLNSPESSIYQKSKILYGLHLAKDFIRETGFVIVVEGYMDFLRLFQEGIGNVVATSGTALTEAHARLLSRFTTKAILCYDADDAGIKAAIRGGEILFLSNIETEILLLPEGEDPDSYVSKFGKEAFLEQTKGTTEYFQFLLQQLENQFDLQKAGERSRAVSTVLEILSRFSDAIKMGFYVEKLAERWQIPHTLIWNQLNRFIKQERRRNVAEINQTGEEEPPTASSETVSFTGAWSAERDLLILLINYYQDISEFVFSYLTAEDLINPQFRKIFEFIQSEEPSHSSPDNLLHAILDEFQDETLHRLITENILIEIQNPVRYLKDCIRKIKMARHQAEIEKYKQQLKETTSDEPVYSEIFRTLQFHMKELQKWQKFSTFDVQE